METALKLKNFIEYLGLTSSQFADMASIPRPTLSQLLTGRNKSISTDLVSKIHDAFPELNISWLLFSEGDMVNDSNTQFSGPQNIENSSLFDAESIVNEGNTNAKRAQIKSITKDENRNNPSVTLKEPIFSHFLESNSQTEKASTSECAETKKTSYENKALLEHSRTKIKQIMVLFEDGTYEVLTP